MTALALCAAAYLLGSIPTGLLAARARGIDIRKVGSGNIGATNVGRALGRRWALAVLAADAAKGFLPVLAGRTLGASPATVAAIGLAAVVGHMFTIFLRGRGGKGVATALGVSLAVSPLAALCALLVYAGATAAVRISSVGSLLGVWTFPVFALALGGIERASLALSIAVAILVTLRHRQNLVHLVRGEEKRSG